MAVLKRYGRHRGSIAVEFALVTPIFLALVGATFYIGLALYTKLLVINAANTAVRNCVILQVDFRSDGDFSNCAASQFAQLTGASGNLAVTCNGGTPQVQTKTQAASYGKLGNAVKVLSLNVTCEVGLGSLMWMSGPSSGPNSIALQIASAMPYTLSRTPN